MLAYREEKEEAAALRAAERKGWKCAVCVQKDLKGHFHHEDGIDGFQWLHFLDLLRGAKSFTSPQTRVTYVEACEILLDSWWGADRCRPCGVDGCPPAKCTFTSLCTRPSPS